MVGCLVNIKVSIFERVRYCVLERIDEDLQFSNFIMARTKGGF